MNYSGAMMVQMSCQGRKLMDKLPWEDRYESFFRVVHRILN